MFQGSAEKFCEKWNGWGNVSRGSADLCSLDITAGSGWINYYTVMTQAGDQYGSVLTFGKWQNIKPLQTMI